jgi:hypothetical protein
MERIAKRSGLIAFNMKNIIVSIISIDMKKTNDFHQDNSVYIPKTGFGDAVSSVDDIRAKSIHLFQIVFRSDTVNASYFSNFINNSDIGKNYRKYITQGNWFPSLSKSELISSIVYLPSIEVQNKVIKSQLKIHELKNELNELEAKIWQMPNEVEDFNKLISQVNHKEGFIDWVETLPFPLASILWSYHTQCDTEKEKYDKLLHFFEAATEFLAIIHLSALIKSDSFSDEIGVILEKELKKNNLSFENTTFGLWVTVFGFIAKSIRINLNKKEEEELVMDLYGVQDFKLMSKFIDKGLVTLFTEANFIRNKYMGHTGAMSESIAANIHLNLRELLSKFRELSIGIWDYYQIVIPDTFRKKDGQLFCKIRNIMGTRTPFVKNEIITNSCLEEDKLHLYSINTQRAIELLPFIKIMPSPKTEDDACYFYNKLNASGEARFISYHYEGDPDISIRSESVNNAIDKIQQ